MTEPKKVADTKWGHGDYYHILVRGHIIRKYKTVYLSILEGKLKEYGVSLAEHCITQPWAYNSCCGCLLNKLWQSQGTFNLRLK